MHGPINLRARQSIISTGYNIKLQGVNSVNNNEWNAHEPY